MKIEKTINDEAVVITFSEGYATAEVVEDLRKIKIEGLERDTLIIDFSKTTHIGSLVFGWLSKTYKILKKENKKIIVLGNKNIEKIFELIGLSRFFKVII